LRQTNFIGVFSIWHLSAPYSCARKTRGEISIAMLCIVVVRIAFAADPFSKLVTMRRLQKPSVV